MKKKANVKNIICILLLIFFAGIIVVFGYRVVVTSDDLPGKLGSVAIAAKNLNYSGSYMEKVTKVSYDTMKYGYMDDLTIARMDYLDQSYATERMDEIRAINDLTAMSEKAADKVAYQKAKAEQEAAKKAAQAAALAAEQAKEAKKRAILAAKDTVSIDTGDSSDTGSGSTASNGGKIGKPVYAKTHGKSLGKYVITAYCTCRICCGVYSGGNRTASGTVPTTNRTIAVDTSVIPFGTKVVINGQIYVAEDRGGAIKGKRIDMFFYTHKEALKWGRRTMEVYLAE